MPPDKRKRFNAFDDFPAEHTQSEAKLPLPGKIQSGSTPQVERIERLKPSQMLPDRYQPRRLLPTVLRSAFFSGQIDCYQAANEWLALAKRDPGYRAEIDRLLMMGGSFEEHGQIKAITGSWVPASNGEYLFLIETGERRFWAACLRTANDKLKEEPLLRIETVQKPTRQRQVVENRHAEPPSAVGQACEVASLILSELNIHPDSNLEDEFEYFRAARAQRMPVGLWDKIHPIMQLTRPRMVQLLNILQLPTHLLELADRYRLPERVIREILALPQDQWERMLRLSIQNSLTSDDIAELTTSSTSNAQLSPNPQSKTAPNAGRIATSGLRRFANALTEMDELEQTATLDEIANDLVISGQADALLALLEDLARLVQVRLEGQRKV